MIKIRKIIQLTVLTLVSSSFCFSVSAINKEDIFRPTKNMFEESDLEKDKIESYYISLGKKTNLEFDGATTQISAEIFKKYIVEDFKKTTNLDIKKYIDNSNIFSVKKENLKNKFIIDLDFKKNDKKIEDVKVKFKRYIDELSKDKNKLQKIVKTSKEDIDRNFEKYRQSIHKDLYGMKKYYKNRKKVFDNLTLKKDKNFLKDFKNFVKTASNSYEIYNLNKNPNKRVSHKEAMQLKEDCNKVRLKSKIFDMYKTKILGPKQEEINKFTKKFKQSLSHVSKKNVLSCLDEIYKDGISLNKY